MGAAVWTRTRQRVAPAAAAGVTVTPSGSTWVNSSWVDVFTSSAECVLNAIVVEEVGQADVWSVIEVGVYDGVSTTVIAAAGTLARDSISSFAYGALRFPLAVDLIPSGIVVRVRMRKNSTNTTVWKFRLLYMEKPVTGNILLTTQPPVANPDGSGGMISIPTNTTLWTNGSSVDVWLSAPYDLAILAFSHPRTVSGEVSEVEIRNGGTAIDVWRCHSGLNGLHYTPLRNPLANIQAGDHITAVWRKNNTNSSNGLLGLTFVRI